MDKHVEMNVIVVNVVIKNQEKMHNLILIQVVNVENQDVLKNIVNVFKMVKNVEHNVNVQIVVMENEYQDQENYYLE